MHIRMNTVDFHWYFFNKNFIERMSFKSRGRWNGCRVSMTVRWGHKNAKGTLSFFILSIFVSIYLSAWLRYHLTIFSFHSLGGTVLPFLVILIFLVPVCRLYLSLPRWSFIALISYFSEQLQLTYRLPFLSLSFCNFTFSD